MGIKCKMKALSNWYLKNHIIKLVSMYVLSATCTLLSLEAAHTPVIHLPLVSKVAVCQS